MLAGIQEFREVDFSHLKINHTDFESVEPARNPQSTLLWCALLLSLLLHLSLLFVGFGSNQPRSKQAPTQTLHIDLLQAPIKKLDAEPELKIQETVNTEAETETTEDVIVSPAPAPVITSTEQSREIQQPSRLVIEPLSPQELTAIVDSHNAQSDYQGSAAIGKNVFHPGLRARLGEEASKPVLARVEGSGPQTYTDPSGAMVVVLGNGKCLKSPLNTKIGAPQNWYMTSCGGKSESEKIMDRVNKATNGKLEFDNND